MTARGPRVNFLYTRSPCTARNLYSSKNHIQLRYVSNLFLCISMEIFLAFFANYYSNAIKPFFGPLRMLTTSKTLINSIFVHETDIEVKSS